ncbi:MAG: glycoside hydrolase family 1 protein [Beutenbergiaceae bacterium]
MTKPLPIHFTFGVGTGQSTHTPRPLNADLALISTLGVDGYRFPISWESISAESRAVADAALDHYDRLTDQLLGAGVEPMATLYQDGSAMPQDQCDWADRSTAERFGEYAATVAKRLADRVAYWSPLNEPNVHARTARLRPWAQIHHQLLGHARAVAALRDHNAAAIGAANWHTPVWAASDSDASHTAADYYDVLHNRSVADPILTGRYPEQIAEHMPVHPGDLEAINVPLDYYGVNYYAPTLVAAPAPGTGDGAPVRIQTITGYPTTDTGTPVVPHGLHETLVELDRRYPQLPPVHITQIGCAHERVNDTLRIQFLDHHLNAIADAIADGVAVEGYWNWSLMDWTDPVSGTQAFGLVHVDDASASHTPRASYRWYQNRISRHRRRR